jgi:phage protein D
MSLSATGGLEMQIDGGPARDVTPFLRKFVWRESMIAGGWYWEARFSTETWEEWEDLILGRDSSDLRVRLKQQGGVEEATEWRRMYIDHAKTSFRGTTLIGRVFGGDIRLAMQEKARTRTWKDATVSDVLSDIADEWKLTQDIKNTAGRRTWWQLREDDWTFARRLAASAATGSGRGDAYMWVDGSNLRFDSPSTSEASARRHDMRTLENRVDRVLVAYNGRNVDRAGGMTLRRIGYDFKTKAAIPFVVDANAASAFPALAPRLPRAMTSGLRIHPTFEETRALVEESARAQWGQSAQRYYSARIDTRGDLTLKPGVVLEVLGNLSDRQEAPFFGRYAVLEVTHALVDSVIVTSATCFRREAGIGDANTSGSGTTTASRDKFRVDQPQKAKVTRQVEAIK